jgi:hypothetical protein
VNEVFRRALVERERIAARDLTHEIFRIGTSHARERRLPGEIGYEPAGIFTPDLRELDHDRYHDTLLPQITGHTASKNGEIRYFRARGSGATTSRSTSAGSTGPATEASS